jgi:hypothetical protein
MNSRLVHIAVAAMAAATPIYPSSTTFWEMNAYADFLRGKFLGVALTRDGRLMLAPRVNTLFSSDQPSVWSVAQAPDGALYLGTGHRGRVYRVDLAGKGSVLWTSDQPEVFAVTVDARGTVYAGTSPNGKVYRIQNGKAEEYFDPKSRYIWCLTAGPDGALYVGTGDHGLVYRVSRPGVGEVYYDTGQANITAMAVDAQGRLLAGSEPNGILYRISAKDKAFVLYDAALPEIRAIVPQPDGTVYAAALGGSVAKRTAALAAAGAGAQGPQVVTGATTTITITDEASPSSPPAAPAQSGIELKPKPEVSKTAQTAVQAQTPVVTASLIDVGGVEKSALFQINPDNTVETLWSSKEENIYDVLPSGKQIWFGTDGDGRIYRMAADRRVTLVAQTNEGETTRLLQSGTDLVAATSSMGKVFRLGAGYGPTGVFEAPIHDASSVARWGHLSWRRDDATSATVVFRTRSGNSARPDRTWSDWSEPLSDARGSLVRSPNARYIQWKAEFAGSNAETPTLSGVTLAYLPQNTPPVVRSIAVTPITSQNAAAAKTAASQQNSGTASYSITVTDTGEAGASTLSGTPTQNVSRSLQPQLQIAWAAEDADGDRLMYSLYFRGEDEQRWKLLRSNMPENALTLDSDVLADGKYFFRVLASDKTVNPPDTAREAELVSAPVLIDNTPPAVTAKLLRRDGAVADIEVDAQDAVSALKRCEYSLDANSWIPLAAADGVLDSLHERINLKLENLPPGEHLVVVRAFDTANNVGLAKIVLK